MNRPENRDAQASSESSKSLIFQRSAQIVLSLVATWRETRFAKMSGRLALADFYQLRASRTDLAGRALYQVFVCERNAIDDAAARAILSRAEASFAAWPNDRDLSFRDVVQYLVISEYLSSHSERGGTTANMSQLIARIIPGEL